MNTLKDNSQPEGNTRKTTVEITLNLTVDEARALAPETQTLVRRCVGKRARPPRYGTKMPDKHWKNCESGARQLGERLKQALNLQKESA